MSSSLPRIRGRAGEGAFTSFPSSLVPPTSSLTALLILILLLTTFPATVLADRQGVIPIAVEGVEQPTGNPYVRGIASHAWWLDPEVYGDQLFPALDELQVTTVRLSIDWRRFEPEPGVFDWGMYDRVLGELARRNIVIIANFNTIPGWASVNQPDCDTPIIEIQSCELREDMYPAFEQAMEAALTRYSWIKHWEFWNEPEMWQYLGQDGPTYLRHLKMFYDIAHRINPEVVVAAQTLIGRDYMEYIYNLSDEAYGPSNEPWDAISIHPYNFHYQPEPGQPALEINYDRIHGLRELMVRRGDGDKKIWITEFGWTNAEEWQARNLPITLDWLQRQPYIEFAHLHMLHDWNEEPVDQFGLMEIVPDENGNRVLDEDTVFEPKPLYYPTYRDYPTDLLGRRPAENGTLVFDETGHSVSGRFLNAWHGYGGLNGPGLPLTRPYPRQQDDGRWLLVQDFERMRLEFHPEYLGHPAEVLPAPVGWEISSHRTSEWPFEKPDACPVSPDHTCIEETGFSLGGGFRGHWEGNGGAARFGYPISREFEENGHIVQYFQRARLEWWPELGPGNEIVVAPIVREQLIAEGWLTPEGTPAGHDLRLPTRREFP